MSSRDIILASIRANLPKLDRPLPAVPKFEENAPADLVEAFGKNLTRMGGRLVTDHAGDLRATVRGLLEDSRLVCSAAPEIEGELDLAAVADPRALADVDHAVVRACCGVAETGSVLLTDVDLKVNALAYLAQHLIVLLDPADIVVNIHSAYARPEFRERRYAVFHSGPSATADIEGVLILGAQGVRSLSVLLVRRNSGELDQAQGGQPVQRLS
jgi:L-lactate dehydrogenase complex protein LldG